ncbi:MAG: hypothetical protein ABIA75_08675, partial [Candidatus Neomarinimicrobiota bacterium]
MVGILILIPVLLLARPTATTVPVASAGSIDLSDWDFQNAGPLKLRGEWALFLNRFIEQDELIAPTPIIPSGYVAVPGPWDEFTDRGQPFGAFGFASYHLKILLSGNDQKLALSFNTISTATRIFVDGQEVGQAGSPGPSRDTMTPDYYPLVIDVPAAGSELNLIVQVSNFYHTQGGLWTDVVIGPESQVRLNSNLNIAISLFIIGSLVVLGLYHMGLYSLREYTKSPFYFGLFSLTIGLRA